MTFPVPAILLGCCLWWAATAQADDRGASHPLLLRDPAGSLVDPLADRGQKATVLFFLTTDCPVGNRYAPEIGRIVRDYQKRGVTCFAIYGPATPEEITRHLKEYDLPLTAMRDPALQWATRTGATVTPEACVLDRNGEVLYRGRVDDRAVKLGVMRTEAKVQDLRQALDEILAGKPVSQKFTKPVGCYIFPSAGVD